MSETIDQIEHEGTVTSVDVCQGIVTVAVKAADDCDACPAAKLCGVAAKDRNSIDVETKIAGAFRKGDKVVIVGTESLHRKAIMLATVLPSLIMIATMIGLFLLTGSQLVAVLSGIGILILFYVVLFLARHKIAHEFRFTIEHVEQNS